MSIKELQAGANYEKFLETEFALIPKKKSILLPQPETVERSTDTLRLQTNIAKNNLKELGIGPGLVNEIIEELKLVSGDLSEFNKYFPTFKKSTSSMSIKNIKDFKDDWDLFKNQRIGIEIQQITTPASLTLLQERKYTIEELQSMSTQDIDQLFRTYLMTEKKTTIDNIDTFKYMKSGNQMSGEMKLYNKGTIITLTGTGIKKGDTPAIFNPIKIKYIYTQMYPDSKPLKKVDWEGPKIVTTGEGIRGSSRALGFKKKRLGRSRLL